MLPPSVGSSMVNLTYRRRLVFENIKVKMSVSEFFEDAKKKPLKNIKGEMLREDWEKVRELAKSKGCPVSRIEQELINFAVHHALREFNKFN